MTCVTTAHLTVDEERTATDAVLRLVGEIDMATAGDLRAAATKSIQRPTGRVVLDFAGVTFCDSQGLSTLISLNRAITAAGSTMVLANVGDFMGRLLEITGLRAAFTVEDNSPA
jgi:anti-anti-sigma factor